MRCSTANTDPFTGDTLAEPYEGQGYIVQESARKAAYHAELDDIYDLPYANTYHPMYEKGRGVPAIDEVRFSLTSCRDASSL